MAENNFHDNTFIYSRQQKTDPYSDCGCSKSLAGLIESWGEFGSVVTHIPQQATTITINNANTLHVVFLGE